MKVDVFAHDPLTKSGWLPVAQDISPDEAANVSRSCGSQGWRVLTVSTECREEAWPDHPARFDALTA